jgi:hypothetical protein
VEAQETGWEGNLLRLTLPDGQTGFTTGALAEVTSEDVLYLGVVRQYSGSTMEVLIEHSLNLARLSSMRNSWG